ncbi:hypothetical protein ACHAWF_006215 [Thalassiosira exigua]
MHERSASHSIVSSPFSSTTVALPPPGRRPGSPYYLFIFPHTTSSYISIAIMLRHLLTLTLLLRPPLCMAQRSDPTQFNGGSILAMAGRGSVAIAIDARFGLGMQTISTGDDPGSAAEGNPRILRLPNSDTLMAWTGLYGDGMGFSEEMSALLARKTRSAGCMGFGRGPDDVGASGRGKTSPRAVASLMSHLLYRRRNAPYYVEPVVVGLERVLVPISMEDDGTSLKGNGNDSFSGLRSLIQASNPQQIMALQKDQPISKRMKYKTIRRPYLCGTDMLGAKSTSHSFVCSGVASRSLHGTAEALWRPDLEGDELVEVCGRAFLSALERDCLSGYGAVVYLIEERVGENGHSDVQIIEYILACRND